MKPDSKVVVTVSPETLTSTLVSTGLASVRRRVAMPCSALASELTVVSIAAVTSSRWA